MKLNVREGETVRYHLSRVFNHVCDGPADSDAVVESADGIDLGAWLKGPEGLTVNRMDVWFEVLDENGGAVDSWATGLRVDAGNLGAEQVTLYLAQGEYLGEKAFLCSFAELSKTSPDGRHGIRLNHKQTFVLPTFYDITRVAILGHAVDRFSDGRGAIPLAVLSSRNALADEEPPTTAILAPVAGRPVVPGESLYVKLESRDNSGMVSRLKVFENGGRLIREIGGMANQASYGIFYTVDPIINNGDIELLVVSEDESGNSRSDTVILPLAEDRPPTLVLNRFSAYKSGGTFQDVYNTPDRLNYGEFWVRSGGTFKVKVDIADDIGLKRYDIFRLDESGQPVRLHFKTYDSACPELPEVHDLPDYEMTYDGSEPVEYLFRVTDTDGKTSDRTILVHPLANIAPQIRITSPGSDQYIAAGTFRLKLGVVVADDRMISKDDVEVYANGKRLALKAVVDFDQSEIGGKDGVDTAYEAIYDSYEKLYSTDTAEALGKATSPHSKQLLYLLDVPDGLIGANETVTMKALVRDSEAVLGHHEISFVAAADEISPDIAVTRPEVGFALVEGSHVTMKVRAFDNVKVDAIEIYTAYGVTKTDGTVVAPVYPTASALSVSSIEARDFLPISTVNIDTPEYAQRITALTLGEILKQEAFAGIGSGDVSNYFLWVKLVAVDASGNPRVREVSYPVLADERPVVDIVSPANGTAVVEGSRVTVQLNAFDDVGIDSVRLRAVLGDPGTEIFNTALRQGPWQFSVTVPPYTEVATDNEDDKKRANRVALTAEVIDSFGVMHNGEESHRSIDGPVYLTIVKDEPPTVAIGKPNDGDTFIEGTMCLVQVNAVDDIGVDRVELRVEGLTTGDRVFSDSKYPFEFLVEIPYGQHGKPITLTATATEMRENGSPRSVTTAKSTLINVEPDDVDPVITVYSPAETGAVAVEKRSLYFAAKVEDNVGVSTLAVSLHINGEQVNHLLLTSPPFQGNIPLKTLEAYLGESAANLKKVDMVLHFKALDGAGNPAAVDRSVVLMRNTPPSVQALQILDSRGYNLGNTMTEITEGREIVVNVIATDPEAGIDTVRLYRYLGESGGSGNETLVGTDTAAPFQFHLRVPEGVTDSELCFKAQAVDLDGYASDDSATRCLTIRPDQPPTATLVEPVDDESVVIDGQPIRMTVETWDDLGREGMDRVVFFVNDIPVQTAYNSLYETSGAVGGEMTYQAILYPPEGVQGFLIYAVAYDVKGQSAQTQTVQVGRLEDTVKPKINLLYPMDAEVLTAGEPVSLEVGVEDIGSMEERIVTMTFVREGLESPTGSFVTLAEETRELGYLTPDQLSPHGYESDPDNYYYLYTLPYISSDILKREGYDNERVRLTVRVETKNHTVFSTSRLEIGLPLSQRDYMLPASPDGGGEVLQAGRSIHYSSLARWGEGTDLLGAWSTMDPARIDPEFASEAALAKPAYTGLFLPGTEFGTGAGGSVVSEEEVRYVYAPIMAGAQDLFAGTITDICAGEYVVVASKAGSSGSAEPGKDSFAGLLSREIGMKTETGSVTLSNTSGEMLLYTKKNGNHQFGLSWSVTGRVDMPYKEVYGLVRTGNLVLVANGHGGIQVIHAGNPAAPYHVGYIKPFGYARDVAVKDHFAVIAASHEGVVIADLNDPAMPVIGGVDTLGVANRLFIEGDTAYVTNLSGDGFVSELTVVDLTDPYHPTVDSVIPLKPARKDLVADGVYDVVVTGGKAYASVLYSDQEDRPVRSMVEVISLDKEGDPELDATVPVVIHRTADAGNFAPRSLVMADGRLKVGASRLGVATVEPHTLSVVDHTPGMDEEDVSTHDPGIGITFSHVFPESEDFSGHLRVLSGSDRPGIGLDVTDLFDIAFKETDGEVSYRRVRLALKSDATLASNTQYFVTVTKGLAPLTGMPMTADYTFRFMTAASGASQKPEISGITPATGGIEGNTLVTVTGQEFGENALLFIGGQQLPVEEATGPDEEGVWTLRARTVPNYAGPASVRVVTESGLEDTVIGGFTYVDRLTVSFIHPAVVRVEQGGEGDRVEVVGYGFHEGIRLRAWQSGRPDSAVEVTPGAAIGQGKGALTLYSSEKMTWTVPDFGASYRGFVDVEVRDTQNRYYLPKALFYGRLQVDRLVETDRCNETDCSDFMPDARKLPPGSSWTCFPIPISG